MPSNPDCPCKVCDIKTNLEQNSSADDGKLLPPALKHWKKVAHHLLVLLLGHGFRHHLVNFIHELGAVVDHFVHRAFLKELAVGITILAVIEIDAAVRIKAAILIASQRHAAALAELGQLAGKQMLRQNRVTSIISRETGRICVRNEIPGRRAVCAFVPAPISGNQFLCQEVGDFAF